ncbi:helix-turn-helix transcriptional regulator [Micromonospora sp. NPDC005305]|uniref:helix-turn-helix domain-containing protein n=1 Tax=Micromonospora sp. NPDC005305 TaxID=3156875 RepID=UPI0033A31EBB
MSAPATPDEPAVTTDEPVEPPTMLTEPFKIPWPASGIVRAVRRRADVSQRELARVARVHSTTIGRIEAGTLTPSIAMLRRIIGVAGFRLAVVDEFGRVLSPMRDRDDLRRRSQWEVRVAKYRGMPPPPDRQRCGYRNGPPPGW